MSPDISRALDIDGWMTTEELMWLATQAQDHRHIAEIGSWRGRSTAALSDNTPGIVTAVDTWAGDPDSATDDFFREHGPDGLHLEFIKNKADNVLAVRATSLDAAAWFVERGKTFDMIFIDGSHDYDSVRADILAWMPLLDAGGLLCGHDYYEKPEWGGQGVRRAVDELLDAKVAVHSIWVKR